MLHQSCRRVENLVRIDTRSGARPTITRPAACVRVCRLAPCGRRLCPRRCGRLPRSVVLASSTSFGGGSFNDPGRKTHRIEQGSAHSKCTPLSGRPLAVIYRVVQPASSKPAESAGDCDWSFRSIRLQQRRLLATPHTSERVLQFDFEDGPS